MTKFYTGVGSRKTPKDIRNLMTSLATKLALEGWFLRTGDATGADSAFSIGVPLMEQKRLYTAKDCTPEAMKLASSFHPAWDRCSEFARKLHGRNSFQVLGDDLKTPSSFLVCWTPDGCVSQDTRSIKTGGTATAIVIAEAWEIPIFNLAIVEHEERIRSWLNGS